MKKLDLRLIIALAVCSCEKAIATVPSSAERAAALLKCLSALAQAPWDADSRPLVEILSDEKLASCHPLPTTYYATIVTPANQHGSSYHILPHRSGVRIRKTYQNGTGALETFVRYQDAPRQICAWAFLNENDPLPDPSDMLTADEIHDFDQWAKERWVEVAPTYYLAAVRAYFTEAEATPTVDRKLMELYWAPSGKAMPREYNQGVLVRFRDSTTAILAIREENLAFLTGETPILLEHPVPLIQLRKGFRQIRILDY